MPKRKRSKDLNEDLGHLMRKILRKLEKHTDKSSENPTSKETVTNPADSKSTDNNADIPTVTEDDWLLNNSGSESNEDSESHNEENASHSENTASASSSGPEKQVDENTTSETAEGSATLPELDNEVLEILGEDPTDTDKRGPDIRKELACRLQHIATQGLSKENRKELIAKYPIPGNCKHIDAPKLNLEIKAAIPEAIGKRDKGIETKQKQMASAISCLGNIINTQLSSKDKNSALLQSLMDANRILCDIQHADTITRRNFILFALKKDMKEHLTNTKIDSYLFGETLADTLKSAKAVNKSGIELKADSAGDKNVAKKSKFPPRPLNQKTAAPARRPLPAAAAPRSREPAAATRAPPPPPPTYSYRTSSHQPPPQPSRRR